MPDKLLVERLRAWADENGCLCARDECPDAVAMTLMREAADAIEELETRNADVEQFASGLQWATTKAKR